MTKTILHALFATFLSLSQIAQAATPDGNISILADDKGRWGAIDAKGEVIVPYLFRYIRRLDDGYFLVSLPSTTEQGLVYGVFNAQGQEIIPPQYFHIEYLRDIKRFNVTINEARFKQGYLDEAGKVVVPVIYDQLERISEIKTIAKRDGKYGYINVSTGRIMIPVEYDGLAIDSLMIDARGDGVAIALKGNKRGVLSTDGLILVPFEFDAIGDITLSHGAPAERDGKLVQLNLKDGVYTGTSEVATQYSSNFVPRPMASINPAPFDGLYVAEDYPTMNAAWDAWKDGKLRWVAIPSIQINGKEAYVSFGLFSESSLPPLMNVLDVSRKRNGFTLMVDGATKKSVPIPFLSFSRKSGVMVCDNCAMWNLPVRWRLLPPEKPQKFGGIGVAIRKAHAEAPGVMVFEVQTNGPAHNAGLKAGDVIMRIDGNPVAPYNMDQVRDMLRGVAGTQVRLSVERDGQLLTGEIVAKRAAITVR